MWRCLSRCMQYEGASGWPRLLYASLLHLCPHTPVEALGALLPHLLPGTLGGARAQELSTCAEALVSQLAEAALHHAGGKAAVFCTNIANVFAAWPPSDRSLSAALRALGGASGVSPLLVFCRKRCGASIRQGLASHAQRARVKQLKGASLDSLAQLLKLDEAGDESDEETPEDAANDGRGDGEPGGSEGDAGGDDGVGTGRGATGGAGPEQAHEHGKLARATAALAKLRASESLYAAAQLPDVTIGGVKAPHGEPEDRPRKAPRRR